MGESAEPVGSYSELTFLYCNFVPVYFLNFLFVSLERKDAQF